MQGGEVDVGMRKGRREKERRRRRRGRLYMKEKRRESGVEGKE